ncbi:MAG: hypothetical protein ICV54_29965 [Nostoc sp. C3-bin3]|nr:hypothetical protein [Nostoc sp. C3-bin3]
MNTDIPPPVPMATASNGEKIACISCINNGLLEGLSTIALATIPTIIEYEISISVKPSQPDNQA